MSLRALPILVMGVCGVGKSTIAAELAARLQGGFVEGDDHHDADAIAAMRAGRPLRDADRWPWLDRVAQAAATIIAEGRPAVIACSALRRAHRKRLRATLGPMVVVCLTGARELLASRIAQRRDHYMPVSLLDSQLALLEPPGTDEGAVHVQVDASSDAVLDAVMGDVAPRLRGRPVGTRRPAGQATS